MGNWWSSEKDTDVVALNKLVTQQSKTIRKLETRIAELEDSRAGDDSNSTNEKKSTPRTYVRRDVIMEWVDKKLEDPKKFKRVKGKKDEPTFQQRMLQGKVIKKLRQQHHMDEISIIPDIEEGDDLVVPAP